MSQVSSNSIHFYLFLIICVSGDFPKVLSMDDFSSGEFYYDNFLPFHSAEVNHNYGGGNGYVVTRKLRPNHQLHCFHLNHDSDEDGGNPYRIWPILNKFKKVKPAPAAPKLDDFDFYYGPQPITKAPFLDDFFDDGYTSSFNDGDDEEGVKKEKVPFEICFMDCPAPNEGKQVCGDDGRTYDNIHKLNCAVRCGLLVKFKSMGECKTEEKEPEIDNYFVELGF